MAYIQVLPEFGLIADPLVGLVTSAGESLSPVLEKVAVLEAVSDDLINMLSGEGNYLASFPNRENGLAASHLLVISCLPYQPTLISWNAMIPAMNSPIASPYQNDVITPPIARPFSLLGNDAR